MTIEALTKVLLPPMVPHEPFGGPWRPLEAELGTLLPPDYQEFARLYGCGYFMEFLGVSIPRASNPNVQLEYACRRFCHRHRDVDEIPYPLWPKPGGLLPVGQTDNGDHIFWLMKGQPAEWPIVVCDHGWTCEVIDRDLTGFLAGLVTGEVLPEAFPEDLRSAERVFTPHWVWHLSRP